MCDEYYLIACSRLLGTTMELATTDRPVPFLPFRCSEEGEILCPCALDTESSQQSLLTEKRHRAVLGILLLVGKPQLWLLCMYLLRLIDGPSPLAVLLSRDPP